MKYNFDEIIDRSGTNCIKTDKLNTVFGRSDLTPLWVADMDFLSPPAVTEALTKRTEHGVFGYTMDYDSYYNSIMGWLDRRHDYKVEKEELTFVPGVVKGFAFAIDTFTLEKDNIIIQPPVYHPFKLVTEAMNRTIINNPLILENGEYSMDFDGLKSIITEQECKMLIFCSPHNPVGRVWKKEELEELAEICYDNNILVISDEIHADFTFNGHKHLPFATVSEKARENSITLMAPSKTFNIAGIVSSFAITHNKQIREKFMNYLTPRELNQGTLYAYAATEAAYNHGEEWLEQVTDYVQKNMEFVTEYLKDNIPQIKPIEMESTFLMWLDCRDLGLSHNKVVDLFVNKAKLALNSGAMFGDEGKGFMRLNVGSPLSILKKAMEDLKNAMEE